jgi:hypothetical protein
MLPFLYHKGDSLNNYSKQIREMTPTQAAYIAGIIDGKGSICLSLRKGRVGVNGGQVYRLNVGVTNTDTRMLDYLLSTTGLGNVIGRRTVEADHQRNRKNGPRWSLWSQQARQLLEAIEPYLVIKREWALLGIEFTTVTHRQTGGRSGLTDEQWEYRRSMYAKFKKLSLRGPGDSATTE